MKARVLVVDDSATVRAHLRQLLSVEFEVECFASAVEALARATAPDLILSDLMMAEMDGAAFCRAVRASATLAEVPFVLLTAWGDPTGKAQGLELGADDYLTKPVRPQELLARVRSLIKLRLARQEIQRQRDALAHQLAERQQMEEQLLFAQRMASVGTLAAGMAHEINNPLAFVKANLQLAIENLSLPARDSPEDTVEALQDAVEGARRIRDVVQGLLAFSRAGSAPGAAQFEAESVDLEGVVTFAVNVTRNELRHRARLELKLEQVPPVKGHHSRLGQVLINLLVNAAQAIPEGRAEANLIRVRLCQPSAEWLAVEVSDTGSGIPQEILGRIFDPFFTTKPVGSGTGLGLSICHGIVGSHGGRIEVESQPGQGTLFRVLLPVPAQAGAAARRESSEPRSVFDGLEALAPLRILVVDDEPLVGRALTRLLGERHQVVSATRAPEALELVGRESFDLLACDLMMPEMTGMELYGHLEAQAPELARRTLFMTGGAFTDAAAQFLDQHSDLTLFKPLDLERVVHLINLLLGEDQPQGRSKDSAA